MLFLLVINPQYNIQRQPQPPYPAKRSTTVCVLRRLTNSHDQTTFALHKVKTASSNE